MRSHPQAVSDLAVNLLFAMVLKEGKSELWLAVVALEFLMMVVNASLSAATWVLLQRDEPFREYLKTEFRSAGKVHLLTMLNPALMLLLGSKLMDSGVFQAPLHLSPRGVRRIMLSELSPVCFSAAVTAIKAHKLMTSRALAPTMLAALLVAHCCCY